MQLTYTEQKKWKKKRSRTKPRTICPVHIDCAFRDSKGCLFHTKSNEGHLEMLLSNKLLMTMRKRRQDVSLAGIQTQTKSLPFLMFLSMVEKKKGI